MAAEGETTPGTVDMKAAKKIRWTHQTLVGLEKALHAPFR